MWKSELNLHWLVFFSMSLTLIAYIVIAYWLGQEIQFNYAEDKRIFIRTVFYAVTIATMPLINLLRHILLTLNKTMLGTTPAKLRYLITLIVCLALVETIGLFGFIMYVLGDGSNTLYIFCIVAALGLFINRPKQDEYNEIVDALQQRNS